MHRLHEQYGDNVEFIWLNAEDGGEGQRLYRQLALPGHPSFVIYDADGQEVFRHFGVLEEASLEAELLAVLE